MSYRQLIALLPCHSLDDFPFYLEGAAADQIFDAYTALWHPALIAHARCTPSWRRNDAGEDSSWENALVAMPRICRDDMPGYWLDEVRQRGAVVLDCADGVVREELIEIGLDRAQIAATPDNPDLLADFLALGLCHLLTEVLTVRMRYSSLLDRDRFSELLLTAADAAVTGDEVAASESLAKCFDALAESKDHFYPVDSYLFDLTLVAPNTGPAELAAEIGRDLPTNLLISAEDVRRLSEADSQSFAIFKQAVTAGKVCLIGGEMSDDEPLSLLSLESICGMFAQGLATYERYLGERPVVFGRRRFGLNCHLPQALVNWGFVGALHYALDGTRCPESYHGAIKWQGSDGSELSALTRPPLDAARAESVLSLPQHLGEVMDNDHVAAIGFAHYPGRVSRWYEQLQRIKKFGSVLGRFVTLKDCFTESNLMSGATQFEADDYRSPYLRELAAAGMPAISPLVEQVRAEAECRSGSVFSLLGNLLSGGAPGPCENTESVEVATAATFMADALPRVGDPVDGGYLILNPYGSPQSVVVETDLQSPPELGGGVKAAAERNGHKEVLVEVPPFGYLWFRGGDGSWTAPAGKPLQESNLLRNEFFEVQLDGESGAIQSVHSQLQRGNVLSQRLAMRMPQAAPNQTPVYSEMVADTIQSDHDGPLSSCISTRGRLLDPSGELLARFEQQVRVTRGVPILYFDLSLDPVVLPQGNPWQNYYAARLAWPGSEISRGVGMIGRRTHRRRLEAPHFLDLRSGSVEVTLLSSGLPYHVLVEDGQIDTLLIVPGETARRFQFAVGFNLSSSAESAWAILAPPMVLTEKQAEVRPDSGWLLHLSAPQVVVTHGEITSTGTETWAMRLRLLETSGRRTSVTLQTFREIFQADKLDFLGTRIGELSPQDDRVVLELGPGEICLLQLVFRK
jgi:alpha-mannosidase